MCVCVCMCVYICVCIYMSDHAIYTHTHTHTHIHTHTYIYICILTPSCLFFLPSILYASVSSFLPSFHHLPQSHCVELATLSPRFSYHNISPQWGYRVSHNFYQPLSFLTCFQTFSNIQSFHLYGSFPLLIFLFYEIDYHKTEFFLKKRLT